MTYIVFIVLGLFAIYNNKRNYNLIITIAIILFAIIIAVFNDSVADRQSYFSVVENATTFNSIYLSEREYGFRIFVLFVQKLNIGKYLAYILYTLAALLMYKSIFRRYVTGKGVNLALFLLLLFPWGIDAVQLRTLMADAIIVFSIRFLEETNAKNILCFVTCVVLAALFHNSALFFIVLAFKYVVKKRRNFILFTVISSFILVMLISNGMLLGYIKKFIYVEKLFYFGDTGMHLNTVVHYIWIAVCIILCLLMYRATHGSNGQYLGLIDGSMNKGKQDVVAEGKILEITYYTNILFVLVLPMLTYSVQFNRLIRVFVIVDSLAFTSFLESKKRIQLVPSFKETYLLIWLFMIALLIYFDCGSVLQSTYWALMNSNNIIPGF